MRKWFRKMLVSLVMILVVLSAGVGYYLQQPKFGKASEGLHLERMKSSPNYIDGQFQNLVPTPQSNSLEFICDSYTRPADIL